MIKEPDQSIKIILLGSSGVGKSSLFLQFVENKFSSNNICTIGVDFRYFIYHIGLKQCKSKVEV